MRTLPLCSDSLNGALRQPRWQLSGTFARVVVVAYFVVLCFLCFFMFHQMPPHVACGFQRKIIKLSDSVEAGIVWVNQTTAASSACAAANNPQLLLNLIKYFLQTLKSRQLKKKSPKFGRGGMGQDERPKSFVIFCRRFVCAQTFCAC